MSSIVMRRFYCTSYCNFVRRRPTDLVPAIKPGRGEYEGLSLGKSGSYGSVLDCGDGSVGEMENVPDSRHMVRT
jgi:hypothetical protein